VRQEIVMEEQQGEEAQVLVPSPKARALGTPAVCLKGG